MTLPAARIFDTCSGHSCYPSRPNIQGSPDCFVNGRAVHRQGDSWAVHCCGDCHGGILLRGSSVTYVNGRQQGRLLDPVSCGSRVATGSSDCYIE